MKIDIQGHSGCGINITENEGKLYVVKTSKDPKYFNRLLKQANKQELAYNEIHNKGYRFDIPKIYDKKIIDLSISEPIAFMKMDYIYAKNYIDFFETTGKQELDDFIQAIIKYIEYEISKCEIINISKQVLLNKFNSVLQNCITNDSLSNESINLVKKVKRVFDELPEQMELPVGCCHGDLTFSNVLFSSNKYYLIDFLDSFIESPLLDIVKLRQDSAYLWSTLMYNKRYDDVRLHITSEKFDNAIDNWAKQYDWYNKYYKVMQLMNFLRIIQYSKKDNVTNYLNNIINNLYNEI